MMKKISLALLSMILMSCVSNDKLLAVRTAAGFMKIGAQTAKDVIAQIEYAKRNQCMLYACEKTGFPSDPIGCVSEGNAVEAMRVFEECYSATQKMAAATDKLWPQLDEALKAVNLALKALQQRRDGAAVDYVSPLKQVACLLTELATWLPEEYRKKIANWLLLVSDYACDKKVSSRAPLDIGKEQKLLTGLKPLLKSLGAKKVYLF